MSTPIRTTDSADDTLSTADEVYAAFEDAVGCDAGQPTPGSRQMGPRRLSRAGMGMDFFGIRRFRPEIDEERRIHHRHSDRLGYPVVVEREKEVRHHAYIWCDTTESMRFSSQPLHVPTKLAAARVMATALSRYLAVDEKMNVGLLGEKAYYSGPHAAVQIAHQLHDTDISDDGWPSEAGRILPRSLVVIFGDFITGIRDDSEFRAVTESRLQDLSDRHLSGFLVMVMDPAEIDFPYQGSKKFNGVEGAGSLAFQSVAELREPYLKKIHDRIATLSALGDANGFQLIMQRTDQPLHQGLLAMHDLAPRLPGITSKPSGAPVQVLR